MLFKDITSPILRYNYLQVRKILKNNIHRLLNSREKTLQRYVKLIYVNASPSKKICHIEGQIKPSINNSIVSHNTLSRIYLNHILQQFLI